MDPNKGIGDFVEAINEEAGRQWWNPAWKYRRRVTIEDPQLLTGGKQAILLPDPDPLLLYNTGRCKDGMADLRVVTSDGTVLPSGVVNFGRDDYTGSIWCMPTQITDFQKKLDLYIYYGNPDAPPTSDKLGASGGLKGDPQFVYARGEEAQPEITLPQPIPGSFFQNLVVAEAEKFVAEANAVKAITVKQEKEKLEIATGDPSETSGEAMLQVTEASKTPVTAWLTRRVPVAGTWYAHVRFKTRPTVRFVAKTPRYEPFEFVVGNKVVRCESQESDGPFRWTSTQVELPEGDLKLGLRATGPAEIDCVILTRDAHYKPDFRDINGPVWMRFKAVEKVAQPFYVDLFCMHTTSSLHGSLGNTASYLFRDRLVYPKNILVKEDRGYTRQSKLPFYAANLPHDARNLFRADEWTPWGETLPRGSFTWYSQIRFMMAAQRKRGRTLTELKMGYEFATRPHPSRMFRSGVHEAGPVNWMNVHMPARLDIDTLQHSTLTFDDWGKQRLAITDSLGFKSGEGPKTIVAGTRLTTYSPGDTANAFKALDAIGLNAIAFRYAYPGQVPEKLFADTKIKYVQEHGSSRHDFFNNFYTVDNRKPLVDNRHPLDPGRLGPTLIPIAQPFEGLNCGQTIEKIIVEKVDAHFKAVRQGQHRSSPWEAARVSFNVMGDEIGPAIGGHAINDHPLFKGFFHEYLKEQGLEPGFFGVKTWDEVEAIDYSPKQSKQEKSLQQVIDDEADAMDKMENDTSGILDSSPEKLIEITPEEIAAAPPPTAAAAKKTDKTAPAKAGEVEGDDGEEANPGLIGAAAEAGEADGTRHSLFEKRAYGWTQKFRSYYTAVYYRHHTAAVVKYYPEGIRTSPNLQAMPIQIGRMWTGALNLFDLGRMNAFNALQLEDWNWQYQNVRFGMDLLRAAARKNGQPLSSLVVGGKTGQRIMANLMQNSRYFYFYTYGPVYTVGPVFAEDKESQRQMGNIMRQIGRAEPDMLAAKNRPVDAAILVANTSETNSAFYKYPFERERVAVYNALNDAQLPVEIVGEEEVLEDNALSRYKILYVVDSHVDSRVQKKIKDWVAAGGTLWADYAGLARQEYDQPTTLMDEVFGLQERGALEPYTYGGYGVNKVPMGQPVNVPKNEVFEADEIKGIVFRGKADDLNGHHAVPNWKVSTGKVLASFGDGKPAIVSNKFGKGQAWLCGFLAGLSYGGSGGPYSAPSRGVTSTPLRGQLITVPAERAGVRQHFKTAQHGLSVAVHDGPQQTVVYLINGQGELKGAPVEVNLPKPAKSAYSGSGQMVEYKANGNSATVSLNIGAGECEILVFKY